MPTTRTRRARFEREHPHLYAARHVIKGAAQVALALAGLAFLIRLLPSIPLPDIDLPQIDLPDLPLPHIDVEVPQWVRDVMRSKQYWLPIVVGIFLASADLRRRRNKVSRDDDRA